MELLQLRYFYESARNESFAKTAEKYMVPASSVSASIRRLEAELGKKLFERQSNRCMLNEAGRELQRSCMLIFDELDGAVERISDASTEAVTIKMLLLCLRDQTVSEMVKFQKAHPEVHFNAVLGYVDADADEFDLIMDTEDDKKYSGYQKIEIASYQLCFYATADSPLVGKELTMKDLRHERFVTMDASNPQNAYLFESCRAAGLYPDVVVQTNDPHCYEACARAGLGISLWRRGRDPHPAGLVEISVSDFHARRTMCLYYRSTYTNTALKEFVEFLRRMQI